jgi:hypothetical protein
VFGGTPNTARETHALLIPFFCPIHLSALLDLIPTAPLEIDLKYRFKGGRETSDYSPGAGWTGQTPSNWIKLNQTNMGERLKAEG